MKPKHTTIKRGYECQDCGKPVPPVTYRAACPACGGPLVGRSPGRGGA